MVTSFAHLGEVHAKKVHSIHLFDNRHDVMVEDHYLLWLYTSFRIKFEKQVPEQVQNQVPLYVTEGLILESYMSGHILHIHPAQSQTSSVPEQQYQLYLAMKADPQLQQQDIAIWLALHMKFERNTCKAAEDIRTMMKFQQSSIKGNFMEEVSLSIDEAKAEKDSMMRLNGKVPDYADTGLLWSLSKVNLTAPTMTFPGIEDHEMFSIIYEPVHGIIYKNSKKEKRVMRHSEIHKFCDATLNRVLEGLKSYNNDVKVRNHTEAYQIFVEMLKKFVRDDLVKLWHLVKERFSTKKPTDDKEKELWVLN
ncbi:hypothetical protein Tco_0894542 [Tanacetum coccineum]|uniref:Uncharacterized protein n=1 Tax=Tanacetum coccineum TaxID=301880 RepID=A0ABQ5CCF4_9ASTR